jgi:hypothetical protein
MHEQSQARTSPRSSRNTAPKISETAEDLAASASDAAYSLIADATDAARSTAQAMQEQTEQVAQNVGRELKQAAENQKTRGVDAIQSFARAISSAADELESQSPGAAQSVRDAVRKIDGLCKNISNRNVDELFSAATEAARSQPLLFMGGAIVAGFALARFFKSSRHQASSETAPAGDRPHPTQR